MSFKIVDMANRCDYEIDDCPRIFETGAEAATASKNLEIIFRKKYGVRPYAPPSDDWKDREIARFEDATYTKVLPSFQKYCLPAHFVHVSKENPEMIAYVQNAFKGSKDIQTRCSIIGYLEKYAKQVSNEEACELQDEHDTAFAFTELKWARTPHEMIHVYTNYDPHTPGVGDSCMRYPHCKVREDDVGTWYGQFHPIYVYGDSELSLAYIENHAGKVIARSLVFEKHKVYSRVYGSGDSTNKLHRFLKRKGYTKSQSYFGVENDEKPDVNKTLSGARIQAIRWSGTSIYEKDYKDSPGTYFIMPYIDEVDDVTLMKDDDEKEYFILGRHPELKNNYGYMRCRQTGGVSSMMIVPPAKAVIKDARRSL